ncbi:hypothetical protein CHUAL_009193 [Chamberlinius hualienensis]
MMNMCIVLALCKDLRDINDNVNVIYNSKVIGCTQVAKFLNANKKLKQYNLIVPLHFDLSCGGKILPNLSEIAIKFLCNKPEFYLNYHSTKGSYKHVIQDIDLMVTKYKL